MELEEALARIAELEGQIETLGTDHTTAINDLTKAHGKEVQKSYNQGFDKAKNASKEEVKDGYVKKEDVDEMLNKRDLAYKRTSLLSKMGVKNPKRALKSIDDEDLESMTGEDFDEEKFRDKYGEDFVFSSSQELKKEVKKEVKKTPSNITKNNKHQKAELTAESYADLSPEDRAKISTAEKLRLLA